MKFISNKFNGLILISHEVISDNILRYLREISHIKFQDQRKIYIHFWINLSGPMKHKLGNKKANKSSAKNQ